MFSKIKDCLDTLGLDKHATRVDVKAAYKKLALQHHPDKQCNNNSDEFLKIKEAYEFLMAWEGPLDYEDIRYDDPKVDWNKIFESLMIKLTETMQKRMNKKHKNEADIKINLPVTLEELYSARVKKLLINVNHEETKQEELYVSLFNYKPTYTFIEKGDWIPSLKKRSNVIVTLQIQPHELIRIDDIISPYDLYINVDISLYEYYCRKYLALAYFNDTIVEVENIYPGMTCACIAQHGLPYYDQVDDIDTRGNLYVHFNLVLKRFKDDILPADVKAVLGKHFVE